MEMHTEIYTRIESVCLSLIVERENTKREREQVVNGVNSHWGIIHPIGHDTANKECRDTTNSA